MNINQKISFTGYDVYTSRQLRDKHTLITGEQSADVLQLYGARESPSFNFI
jgi:hypothetical protein